MKGKQLTLTVVTSGLVLVLVAGLTFRDRAVWQWYRWMGTVDSEGVPIWLRHHQFDRHSFDFVRIEYGSWNLRGRGGWLTDFPDAELNLSARLREVTSLDVAEPKVLSLTDAELEVGRHPFIYITEAGRLAFSKEEASALRRYLLDGGFLMVDDFWGDQAWLNFYREIKKVFPDREPTEVPRDHEIFRCVFDLTETPLQVPSIAVAHAGRASGVTWEGGPDTQQPHFRAIQDDVGRILVFICHNTDTADGWERADRDEFYYEEFCRKRALPLAINVVFYVMTR